MMFSWFLKWDFWVCGPLMAVFSGLKAEAALRASVVQRLTVIGGSVMVLADFILGNGFLGVAVVAAKIAFKNVFKSFVSSVSLV